MSKFSEMIAEMSDEIHKYIRKCIESASFDKSRSARITQVLDNNEYVVTMSDGAVRTVPSLSSDSFNVNDVVRVTVAQNDSKNSYIIGKPNIPKGSSGGGVVDSVNGQTGTVVLNADDISDASTTNKFVTSADKTKLSNLSGVNTGDQDLSVKADKYIAGTAYPSGASVIHNGHLWVNTSGASTVNVEPGTNYNVWNVTYCNSHIEDNGYFVNPVNQRGQTSYTTAGYTIDRWRIDVGNLTVTVTGSCVTITPTISGYNFSQVVSDGNLLAGKTVTLSFDCAGNCNFVIGVYNGTTWSYPLSVNHNSTSRFITSVTGVIPLDTQAVCVYVQPQDTNIVTLYRSKLELGSVSTLANDPPADYGEELRKCQRYYIKPNGRFIGNAGGSVFYFFVPLPVSMRVTPTSIIENVGFIILSDGEVITPTSISVLSINSNGVTLTAQLPSSVTSQPGICGDIIFSLSSDL